MIIIKFLALSAVALGIIGATAFLTFGPSHNDTRSNPALLPAQYPATMPLAAPRATPVSADPHSKPLLW